MQPTTLKGLEWVHDCVLQSVLYDTLENADRSIKITMRCPLDLGYAPWEGKSLALISINVAVSKHVALGFCHRPRGRRFRSSPAFPPPCGKVQQKRDGQARTFLVSNLQFRFIVALFSKSSAMGFRLTLGRDPF
jgi:hypothetical protein